MCTFWVYFKPHKRVEINDMGIVTMKTYFDFSNKSSFKQFVYGNILIVLHAFWVSLSYLFFFRVNSDKETSLVVSEKQNTNDHQDQKLIGGTQEEDKMERSLVSISKRCEFYTDKNSITGFVEEPKAFCFKFLDYSAIVQEEEKKKMVSFSDIEEPILEKSESDGFVKEHMKEEMLVYEFMSCGVLKELLDHEEHVFDDDDDDDGFIELNPSLQISNIAYGEEEEEDLMQREEEMNMGFDEEEEVYDDDSDSDDDDDDEFEHSDVIEKLKTEMRTARTGGLCTILEESETPLEELKPLKIEPKPDQLKDRINEIHKVYKNYAVKMRKLDVIDSQTMHSISLLKIKEASTPSRNTVKPPKSPLNLWPLKKHKLECDRIERLVKEASRDFETVYVGQLCLSWEMLQWQYTKVLEFDSQVPINQFNLVAGEFQLFQVLLQRFVENEPFQNSSRVETYLKNRRHFHSFLQIPLVRDDRSSKTSDKKCRYQGEFAVKIEMLREIIRESMSVFWEFLCADKDEFTSMMKVSHQTQVSPQDPLDLELLTDIRTHLQKKEKKLKEILRSQSCIVKKLKKNESKSSSIGVKDELLIAQIELRLVSRVMNMSKLTTEKLVWCREKLERISFNGRKIYMEPSFSLLPC